MARTNSVFLMKSIQSDEFGKSEIEQSYDAVYAFMGGSHIVLYDDISEETGGKTSVIVKITEPDPMRGLEASVEMVKKGEENVRMVFAAGPGKYTADYQMPFIRMQIGISTTEVMMEKTQGEVHCRIRYGLDINLQPTSDFYVDMRIRSKDITP